MRSSIALICSPRRSNASPAPESGTRWLQVAGADPVGDRGDIADPRADVMGEYDAAEQAEQARDDQREEERAFERGAERDALADEPPADQPLAVGSRLMTICASCGLGLPAQPDDRASIAVLSGCTGGQRARDCRISPSVRVSSATAVCGSA